MTRESLGSKRLALLFLAGAVLVGGMVGFTANRVLTPDSCAQPRDRKAKREHFHSQLELTAAQRVAVDSLLDRKSAQIATIMRPIQPQLDAISDSSRAQIAKLLTPAQREKFDRMHREMVAARKAAAK